MASLHGVICVGLGFRVDAQLKRAQVWLPLTVMVFAEPSGIDHDQP